MNMRVCASATLALTMLGCGSDSRSASVAASAKDTITTRAIPGPAASPMRSPDSYNVRVTTNKGAFTIAVTRSLAPHGADRFYELVSVGYFTDVRFFRVMPGFVAQFGLHGTPAANAQWSDAVIPDEPMRTGNTRGTVAFSASGPTTRSNQLFISLADNRSKLDRQRMFSPIGNVTEGMDVVEKLNSEYGDEPNQSRINFVGNEYLRKWFPALDYIVSATIVSPTNK